MKYWAFISYSHRDSAVADWLHKKLETYRVPRALVGTPSREGEVPARIIPIFRDRDELPTSAELGDNLQKCLQQSRYLIVICSPASAKSRWVGEEVRAFKGWHGRDRIIALIAGGVPNATDRSDPENECFPRDMRFDVDDTKSEVRVEPIAADVRPEGDGRQRALLKIVAGLLGVGFDDLYQREKRRQKRRQILIGAVAAICLLGVAGIYASIARLGQSQKEMRGEIKDAGRATKLMTTEFKDVRPKNKEAEDRIRAAADRASAALDALEEARLTKSDEEYKAAYESASSAVIAVPQVGKTAEEQMFAAQLQKPLSERLVEAGKKYGQEITRRAMRNVRRDRNDE